MKNLYVKVRQSAVRGWSLAALGALVAVIFVLGSCSNAIQGATLPTVKAANAGLTITGTAGANGASATYVTSATAKNTFTLTTTVPAALTFKVVDTLGNTAPYFTLAPTYDATGLVASFVTAPTITYSNPSTTVVAGTYRLVAEVAGESGASAYIDVTVK